MQNPYSEDVLMLSLEPLPANGPDFGALGEEAEFVEVEPEAKQEILENKDVVVQHVHFDGLGRTKDDIIMYEIGDVMRKSHEARDDALPNGLDVTFEVTELRRLTGSYNTMVGNNEGSMVCFSVNLYKVTGQFPWSSLRETDRGVSAECSFPIWKTSHTVKWEGVWRELGCLSRTASFAVRKESGHSLKSSLSHAMVIDSRNSSILPRRGALLKVNQELAGYTGGDVNFIKEDFELQLNKQLIFDSVFSASLWGGMLVPIGDKPSSIADRFYLGGPTSVRGFSMHSVGPQSEGDYLGGEAYWAGGLHLYTPLPFRPGQGGFGELFRTHFFLNAGNLCNLNYGDGPKAHIRKLAECIRWSYGAGIVLRLGNIARLELNYCVPMGVQTGDRGTLYPFTPAVFYFSAGGGGGHISELLTKPQCSGAGSVCPPGPSRSSVLSSLHFTLLLEAESGCRAALAPGMFEPFFPVPSQTAAALTTVSSPPHPPCSLRGAEANGVVRGHRVSVCSENQERSQALPRLPFLTKALHRTVRLTFQLCLSLRVKFEVFQRLISNVICSGRKQHAVHWYLKTRTGGSSSAPGSMGAPGFHRGTCGKCYCVQCPLCRVSLVPLSVALAFTPSVALKFYHQNWNFRKFE
ncbi:hypothetical protein HPG69_006290 [Diceros bicornis minor]|uniref:Bacterial surface antigen (D15) domain-containing protein n=1 Tax=Diceros bicornis minor TaxID=77932 RepID=A0A7J7FNV8_DICBM|nr:hypothetical protein HPG69_006290 [Diceros bicornis minor]